MIRSRLSKFAWVYFVIFLSITSISAQNNRGKARNNSGTSQRCLEYVVNLTEEQEEKIAQLIQEHRSEMAALRTEMQSATSIEARLELRKMMQEMIEAHRAEIRSVLTEEQLLQYDQMQENQNHRGIRQFNRYGSNGAAGNRGPGMNRGR